MKNTMIYEMIFRFMLLIPAAYHIYKRQYKVLKSLAAVLVLSFLPAACSVFFQITIDTFSRLIYDFVLFMAMYLGSSRKYYDKYSWWDRIVHFLSGLGFVGFGTALAASHFNAVIFGILLFGFTFSITLHVFWEVLEYLTDCITHSNAQRWQKIHNSINHQPEAAIQPPGLVDTMNDLICCLIGAVLATAFWAILMLH